MRSIPGNRDLIRFEDLLNASRASIISIDSYKASKAPIEFLRLIEIPRDLIRMTHLATSASNLQSTGIKGPTISFFFSFLFYFYNSYNLQTSRLTSLPSENLTCRLLCHHLGTLLY